jgi:hypothetical protein
MSEHNCRVCGLYINELPWEEDGQSPTYEICPCCGVEFGNEDYTIESIKKYRTEWIQTGAKWFSPKEKPFIWNIESQLQNIPKEFL